MCACGSRPATAGSRSSAHEPVPDLPIGREVVASGTLRERRSRGRRATWRATGSARSSPRGRLRLTGGRRGGLAGDRRSRSATARSGAWTGHAGAGGRAPARLRPRRGRPHRPRDGRRLQALGARAPARRQRGHVMLLALLAAPLLGAARRAAAGSARVRAGADRPLRPGDRRRPVDPARRDHGRRGRGRGPRRAPALALVRRAARRARRPSRSTRARAATPAGSSASRPWSGSCCARPVSATCCWASGRDARAPSAARRAARRGRRGDDRGDARHGAADGARFRRRLARLAARPTSWRCPRSRP